MSAPQYPQYAHDPVHNKWVAAGNPLELGQRVRMDFPGHPAHGQEFVVRELRVSRPAPGMERRLYRLVNAKGAELPGWFGGEFLTYSLSKQSP